MKKYLNNAPKIHQSSFQFLLQSVVNFGFYIFFFHELTAYQKLQFSIENNALSQQIRSTIINFCSDLKPLKGL